jgi:hypothetical protein
MGLQGDEEEEIFWVLREIQAFSFIALFGSFDNCHLMFLQSLFNVINSIFSGSTCGSFFLSSFNI